MDFITWWFEVHYIWSTLLTPVTSFVWLIYTDGNGWRMVTCLLLALVWMGAK